MSGTGEHSSRSTIGLVAAREFRVRITGRAFLITTAGLLVLSVVGILVASLFGGPRDVEPTRVGLVGGGQTLAGAMAAAGERAGQPVRADAVADPALAREQVRTDGLDAALIAQPDGSYTVVTEAGLDDLLRPVLAAGVEQSVVDQALLERGVAPGAVAQRLEAATLTSAPIEPPRPDAVERTFIAYVSVVLLFFSVFFYGLNVAIGVVEEKASRVVELLLSTIKPIDLLAGKVLGIGAVGFVQLVAVAGASLVAALATGLLTISGTAVTLFGIGLVWYVLGFLFYAVLYAAAGSLVSRQEDVNAVTMPLILVSFVAFFAAQFSLTNPGLGAIEVMSWVPPFSATLMPLRYAQGDAGGIEVGIAMLIMAVATVLATFVAARVYRRSVLGSGGKQSLGSALSGAGAS